MKFYVLAIAGLVCLPGIALAQNGIIDRALQRQNGAYGQPPKHVDPDHPDLQYGTSNINPLTGQLRRAAPSDSFTTGDYFAPKPVGKGW